MDRSGFLKAVGADPHDGYTAVERLYWALRKRIRSGEEPALPFSLSDLDSGMEVYRAWWAAGQDVRIREKQRGKAIAILDRGGVYVAGNAETGKTLVVTAHEAGDSPDDLFLDHSRSVHIPYTASGLDRLASDAESRGWEWRPAELGQSPGISAIAILNADEPELLEALREARVPYLVRWTPTGFTIVDTETGEEWERPWSAHWSEKQVADPVGERRRQEHRSLLALLRREKGAKARIDKQQQGWPDSWPLAHIRRWERAGGTAQSAAAFEDGGWSSEEVVATLKATGGQATLDVPAVVADRLALFGDTLDDVLTDAWPRISDGTVMSIKRTYLDGTRQRVVLSTDTDVRRIHEWRRESGHSWTLQDDATSPLSVAELVALDGRLTEVTRQCITDVTFDEESVESVWVLSRLTAGDGPSEDPDDWPHGTAEDWSIEDCLPYPDRGVPWVDRWCTVNGMRVTGIEGNRQDGTICLVGLDNEGARETGGLASLKDELIVIARYSWWSDGGGAPISWDGGNALCAFGTEIVIDSAWGDVEPGVTACVYPRSLVERTALVAAWIAEVEALVPAAMALENLDPQNLLNPSQRNYWLELLDGPGVSFSLDESLLDVAALRRALLKEPYYARMARALEDPLSTDADALRRLLERGSSEPLAQLLTADW